LPSRRERTILCRIRNAPDCSASVIPASILTSTDRTATVASPDFISLQARDLDTSQAFYEQYLGLVRSPAGPAHAVVFETKPITFALRDVVPGTDLASVAQPGIGAAICPRLRTRATPSSAMSPQSPAGSCNLSGHRPDRTV
jgi:hypothetical protein